MKKMSNRDIKLLYYMGAIIIVAACYFFIFTKLNEKKNTLVDANATLQTEVARLETMEAKKKTVTDETAENKQEIANLLSEFPEEVRIQNAIYSLNQMYKGIDNVKIQSEGYTMNQIFYETEAGAAEANVAATTASPDSEQKNATGSAITDKPVDEIVTASASYVGYRSDVAVAFTAPYHSLKEVIDYINNSKERMTITSISATKDQESDDLNCSMTVSMYAISGTGEGYDKLKIGEGDLERGNIFKK